MKTTCLNSLSKGSLMLWRHLLLSGGHLQIHSGGGLGFCDIASAFDTVEYPILLDHLENAGISGKAWRLIKDWYTNVQSSVRVSNSISAPFPVCRGVRQGLVLSPIVFLLVMDPILLQLKSKSCGLSVGGIYLGALSQILMQMTFALSPLPSPIVNSKSPL